MAVTVSFRRKIFLSFLLLFLLFLLFLFPLTYLTVKLVQEQNLKNETVRIWDEIKEAPDVEGVIAALKKKAEPPFFALTLFDENAKALYDAHGNASSEASPEVEGALAQGKGYGQRYSSEYGRAMVFMAVPFSFEGKTLVLRIGYPLEEFRLFDSTFVFATFCVSAIVLLFFGLFAGLIVEVLTKPIKQIISAIKSYRGGKEEFIPEIRLSHSLGPKDEFGQLSDTLNSLSKRIESQISNLTREKNNKSAILESLGEGVIAVDQSMTVIYINHMAELFLDLKREDILGKNFALAKQEKCHQLIHEAQVREEPVLAVLQLEKKPKRFLDALAVPRGKEGAILVLQDRTSLHKVIELGRDFIANASHELKTPITIIRGFAETLYDHPELSKETYKEITAKIVSNCERMEKLVRNLLTLAAIDEGLPSSRLQECDLTDLMHSAKQTVLTVHPHAQIDIVVKGEPPYLLVDPDLLLQAILNLMDNAVKYSKPPAKVTLTLEEKQDEVTIQIQDKGLGIPQQDLEKIFERFYSVDKSYSRSMGGSGLGLSIVARIIEKHQGKIYVESEVGVGSTFTLIFPALREAAY